MVKKASTGLLLFKMRLRSIKKCWAQFLSVIAIGAIAVTLFVGLLANAESFEKRVNTVYEEGNLASVWVTVNNYDEEDETKIRSFLEEGDALETRLYAPIEIGSYSSYVAVSHSLPTISKAFNVESLNDGSDGDFFFLDKGMKKVEGSSYVFSSYSLGDEATLSMDVSSYGLSSYSSYLEKYVKEGKKNIFSSNEISLSIKVTGFMDNPENINKSSYNPSMALLGDKTFKNAFYKVLSENYNDEGITLIEKAFSLMLNFHSFSDEYWTEGNQYVISLKDENRAKNVKEKILDYFDGYSSSSLLRAASRSDMPFYITLDNDLTQARQFTFVFPFVFFLVAFLVISTTLSQYILQERTQIGALKAIGLKRKEIYWHYSSLTLLLVGLGTLIGEIVGPILIPNILGNKYAIFYTLPALTYSFPVLYGILTAVVFLALSVIITLLVCHKEVALPPSESMRPKKPSVRLKAYQKKSKMDVYALSVKMAFRNIRLNIGKSAMVAFGVLGCTALLLCGFGIEDTVYHGIDSDIATLRNFDVTTTFMTTRTYEDATKDLLAIEGVEEVEATYSASSDISIENGASTNSRVYLLKENSRCYKISFPKDEVAISQKVSRVIGAKEGDTVTFTFMGKSLTAEVGLVYEAFATHGVMLYDDAPFLRKAGITSYVYSGAQVYVKDGYSADEVNTKIKDLSYIISSETLNEWQSYISDIMSGVIAMTNAVKVFAILLALTVLYNLSLLNFVERGRDIATLKVLGFSRFEIALSLLLETMSLTLLGTILGMALGYPFLLLVLGTNIVELVEYMYFIKPVSYVFAFLLTFVVAFIVNLFFSLKSRSIKMVESLKSVE